MENSRTRGLTAIAPLSVVDNAATQLRHLIVTGVLPQGEPFAISDISTELGVSHIPIREALRRLESEGLIQFRPNRKVLVRPHDPQEVKSIYRLRRLIEPPLAIESCHLLTDDDLAHAQLLLDAYQPQTRISLDSHYSVHSEFHMVFLRPAASDWDLRFLSQLWSASERYVRILLMEDEADHLVALHKEILDAALNKAPNGLGDAVRYHLYTIEAAVLAAISEASDA